MSRRRGTLAAAGCVVAMAIAASGAQAATVTVGSPLTGNYIATAMGAGGDVTFAQTALPGATVASPTDGTIVSWRNRTLGGPFRLVVVRPVGAQYANAGSSDLYEPVDFAASPVIPVSLPVLKGDLIGIETTTGNGFDAVGIDDGVTGAAGLAWTFPHLAPGPPRAGDPLVAGSELAMQAVVRYCAVPKLKGKRVKAARKALAAGGCTLGKIKRPKGKARARAKFVRKQTVPAGSSISDTAPVGIKLGPKRKSGKAR
jgi:hypothetical protein